MESRCLLAADVPLGATPVDTGEFLLGTVTVTPVFFESNGAFDTNTQDWSPGEIDQTLVKVRESVDWWSDLLATQTTFHSLDFVIDDTYARNPVDTGYEPIDRSSDYFQYYVGDWLTDLGYGDAPSIERAMHLFNDSQRRAHQTDWAFTIFVVDSSDDADGFFAPGGFNGAFAYAGGLFSVVPSERPVSTYSHEMGHIFWARDEYPGAGSWTDHRGYYNAQNWNAADNPTLGFVQDDSIMRGGSVSSRAFDNVYSPASTLALIGWRDSDGDGIFDLADVPIELDAVGAFDPETAIFSFEGSASVGVLANQNSEGPQSDITLNRIDALQYRLDSAEWVTVLTPGESHVDFDLQIPISEPFQQIEWRAIQRSADPDSDQVLESNVLSGRNVDAIHSGIVGGVAFLDANGSGLRETGERLLDTTQFTLKNSDGSPLHYVQIAAAALPEQEINAIDGLTFSSTGSHLDGRVAAIDSASGRVFQSYNTRSDEWTDLWTETRRLDVLSDQAVGRVAIDFIATDQGTYGLEGGSFARVEAYDADGNRVNRVTSESVAAGEQATLVVEDPTGRITRVVVYGHAETKIQVSAVRFGHDGTAITNLGGAFSVSGLPDGTYSIDLVPPNLTYQFAAGSIAFDVVDGQSAPIVAAVTRVDSPRHNGMLPADVNGDGEVTPRDALAIINDIARNGSRVLTASETSGAWIDTNNDGSVSAIDALRVINYVAIHSGGSGAQGEQTVTTEALPNASPEETPEPALVREALAPAAFATTASPAVPLAENVDLLLQSPAEGEFVDGAVFQARKLCGLVDPEGEPSGNESSVNYLSDSSHGRERRGLSGDGAETAEFGVFPVNSSTLDGFTIRVDRHL